MDWDIEDEALRALGGERVIVTFDVAELVPGTYVYLDADDEIIMEGAVLEPEPEPEPDDAESGVPPALPDFGDTDLDRDTDPDGRTIVGPPPAPRTSRALEPAVPPPIPARTATIQGSPIRPRPPEPDHILNEIDDDDGLGGLTEVGSPIRPRLPAPAKERR